VKLKSAMRGARTHNRTNNIFYDFQMTQNNLIERLILPCW